MDFATLLAAVDSTTITAAIGSIAVIKFGPVVAAWGYRTVMKFLGR